MINVESQATYALTDRKDDSSELNGVIGISECTISEGKWNNCYELGISRAASPPLSVQQYVATV